MMVTLPVHVLVLALVLTGSFWNLGLTKKCKQYYELRLSYSAGQAGTTLGATASSASSFVCLIQSLLGEASRHHP